MFQVSLVFVNQEYVKVKPMASGRKGFAKTEKLKTLFRIGFGCGKTKTCKYETKTTTITAATKKLI